MAGDQRSGTPGPFSSNELNRARLAPGYNPVKMAKPEGLSDKASVNNRVVRSKAHSLLRSSMKISSSFVTGGRLSKKPAGI